jgi:hypothetical protein
MTSSISSQWPKDVPGASAADRPRTDTYECVRVAEHLTVTEASELLDWLEGHGIEPSEVSVDSEGRMTVRWLG